MPAVDAATGRLLLEAPDRLAVSPNGHGGMLAAFAESGAMADAQGRGIRHLFYFQVDNPLVDIGGPEYIGYHILSASEMTSQVIAKRDPLEKVGNVVDVDGRLMVIGYSDLPEDVARKTNADGSLAIWAGSIAVHVFDLDFLPRRTRPIRCRTISPTKKWPLSMPRAAAWNRRSPTPSSSSGSSWISCLRPATRSWSKSTRPRPLPLKNAPGAAVDTPEAVKAQFSDLHRQWLRAVGVDVPDRLRVEINPRFALDVEELRGKVRPGMKITEPTYLS